MNVTYEGDSEAFQELADGLNELPRNTGVGYQGRVRLKKVLTIPIFEALDGPDAGEDMVMDLAQAKDGRPDFAVRKWITVRGAEAGGRELVEPGKKNMGALDLIKALSGDPGSGLAGIATGFFEKLIK
jgi:hypothetical protein